MPSPAEYNPNKPYRIHGLAKSNVEKGEMYSNSVYYSM